LSFRATRLTRARCRAASTVCVATGSRNVIVWPSRRPSSLLGRTYRRHGHNRPSDWQQTEGHSTRFHRRPVETSVRGGCRRCGGESTMEEDISPSTRRYGISCSFAAPQPCGLDSTRAAARVRASATAEILGGGGGSGTRRATRLAATQHERASRDGEHRR
jgi:hypothetical protein